MTVALGLPDWGRRLSRHKTVYMPMYGVKSLIRLKVARQLKYYWDRRHFKLPQKSIYQFCILVAKLGQARPPEV